MRRTVAVTMATIALVVGPALTMSASAVPMKKCTDDPENFQIVNGKCVSDGRAEKLNDGHENENEHGPEHENEKD